MLQMRYPFTTTALLRNRLEPLLDAAFGDGLMEALFTGTSFPMNVWEDQDALHVEAELPGVAMEDVEVLVEGDELTLKGRRPTTEAAEAGFHRRERGTGAFCRSVTLPVEVEADKVEAVLKNGVLSVTLPKAERIRPRKIAVQVR
jgi:HSP20 family protein